MLREQAAELVDRYVCRMGNHIECQLITKIFVDIIYGIHYSFMRMRIVLLPFSAEDGAVDLNQYLCHNAALDHVITVATVLTEKREALLQARNTLRRELDSMIEAVLMGIEALR